MFLLCTQLMAEKLHWCVVSSMALSAGPRCCLSFGACFSLLPPALLMVYSCSSIALLLSVSLPFAVSLLLGLLSPYPWSRSHWLQPEWALWVMVSFPVHNTAYLFSLVETPCWQDRETQGWQFHVLFWQWVSVVDSLGLSTWHNLKLPGKNYLEQIILWACLTGTVLVFNWWGNIWLTVGSTIP